VSPETKQNKSLPVGLLLHITLINSYLGHNTFGSGSGKQADGIRIFNLDEMSTSTDILYLNDSAFTLNSTGLYCNYYKYSIGI
jgi:hypothetical protein